MTTGSGDSDDRIAKAREEFARMRQSLDRTMTMLERREAGEDITADPDIAPQDNFPKSFVQQPPEPSAPPSEPPTGQGPIWSGSLVPDTPKAPEESEPEKAASAPVAKEPSKPRTPPPPPIPVAAKTKRSEPASPKTKSSPGLGVIAPRKPPVAAGPLPEGSKTAFPTGTDAAKSGAKPSKEAASPASEPPAALNDSRGPLLLGGAAAVIVAGLLAVVVGFGDGPEEAASGQAELDNAASADAGAIDIVEDGGDAVASLGVDEDLVGVEGGVNIAEPEVPEPNVDTIEPDTIVVAEVDSADIAAMADEDLAAPIFDEDEADATDAVSEDEVEQAASDDEGVDEDVTASDDEADLADAGAADVNDTSEDAELAEAESDLADDQAANDEVADEDAASEVNEDESADVDVEGDDTLSRIASIRAAQTMLEQMRYDVGPADGAAGDSTIAAADAFADARGLNSWGFDNDFLEELRVAMTEGHQAVEEAAEPETDLSFAEGLEESDLVREAQRLLNVMAYEAGKVDGKPGPSTRSAATSFSEVLDEPFTEFTPEFLATLRDAAESGHRVGGPLARASLVPINRIRESQWLLNEMGYSAGEPDGSAGSRTLNAAAAFATDRDLDAVEFSVEFLAELRRANSEGHEAS